MNRWSELIIGILGLVVLSAFLRFGQSGGLDSIFAGAEGALNRFLDPYVPLIPGPPGWPSRYSDPSGRGGGSSGPGGGGGGGGGGGAGNGEPKLSPRPEDLPGGLP